EKFAVSAHGDQALLTRDVGGVTMTLTSVEHIQIAALGGADSIVVGDLTGAGVREVGIDLGVAGSGDGQTDTVTGDGSAGNDHISVTSNGGSIVVEGLAARVTIDGAEANDLLIIDGAAGNDSIDASAL